MFGQYFGHYLMENGLITSEQFAKIMDYQDSNRARLGIIAVSEGLLTPSQAEELNRLQVTRDKRFGDLAVEKKYLTESDISHLLKLQGNPYLIFIQALEENNIMPQNAAEAVVARFQKERRFTNSDLTAVKNGDVDALLSVFMPDAHERCYELVGLALRNYVRFVTPHFRIEMAERAQSYTNKYIAFQRTTGDFEGFLGFATGDNSILKIANSYARENFEEVDEDSLDSVCEFTNCINGLFATELSHKNVNIDMLPPQYRLDGFTLTAKDLYVLPIYMREKQIDVLVSIAGHIDIN